MLYNYIALGVIGVCLLTIVVILVRKFPRLKTLDVSTIAEEKESKVKEKILIERLKRRATQSKYAMSKVVSPSSKKMKNVFSGFYKKIIALEKKYQRESASKSKVKDAGFEENMKGMITQAEALVKKEDYSEAEKTFIEVISLDPQNKKAYCGLTNVYLEQKEYQQAIQTLNHVLKLDLKKGKKIVKSDERGHKYEVYSNAEDITEDFIKLGEVYKEMGDHENALNGFKTALSHSPNDPKSLDLLIETSIQLKNKNQAFDYFKKLESVNPKNQKLLEYRKKLEEM